MTTQKENFKSEYKCKVCGKPATVNIQDAWHKYSIDKEGNFTETKSWDGNINEFYCDKHADNA